MTQDTWPLLEYLQEYRGKKGFTVNKGNPIHFQTILLGLSHIKLNLVFLKDPNSDVYSLLISTQSESNFCQ